MDETLRVVLWFVLAGVGLLILSSAVLWWSESSRRLTRGLLKSLGKPADAIIYDLDGQKAAGLDFSAGDIAVLWECGRHGLVFSFDEIDGAELIVDEKIVARTQKGETRRVMDETYPNASRVTLRLMFDDIETPEFEVELFGQISQNPVHPKTAADAVRLGRKWLSHVDAVIKRPAAVRPRATGEDHDLDDTPAE